MPDAMGHPNPVFTNGYEFSQGSGYTLPEYPFVEPPELRSGRVLRHPVVVVGAGITGLTLACRLAQLGVPAVLVDEDNTVGVKGAASRGICYTQKSLEIFHRIGIYERIAARGIQWSVGRTFAGQDEVYAFDLKQQSQFGLSSQPAFMNIQQFYIEGYLVEQLQQLGGVEVRWKSRVTGFVQHQGFATLTIDTPAGAYPMEATHVVDASGSHTPFHAWCAAGMTSRRGDDRWCIADVRFKDHPPSERHTWIEAPFNGNRAVWQHLMADDVWRIDYQMAPDADPQYVSREDVVMERLRQQFGPDVQCEIVWVGPYAYRSQCLDHLHIGSVFFIGDTAKIVSPFGARGGNTGVADADNLAWKLAAVFKGQAPQRLLASYQEERHEAAVENVRVTNRTARFLRPADGLERLFRNAAISLAKQYPFARSLINTGRMAVANNYTRSGICHRTGGVSVQNVAFEWADGTAGTVNALLNWANSGLLLLVFGPLTTTDLQRLRQLSRHAPVRCVQVLAGGRGQARQTQARQSLAREHVLDPQGVLASACHLPTASPAAAGKPAQSRLVWALIRPDGYLAAHGEKLGGALVQAVGQALGLSTSGANL